MGKKLEKAFNEFFEYFGYFPNTPNDINFDEGRYADLLLKCIADRFDYTIEMYGTIVSKKMPLPEIIYD